MRIADPAVLKTGVSALQATTGALFAQVGDLFDTGEVFNATLIIDQNVDVPGAAELLHPGATHRAVVQVGPDGPAASARSMCIKIPDAYGEGSDQDFLLASSGDGAPLHHAVLPADPVAPLYSSLWLYLAGIQPVLFGVRTPTQGPDVRFGPGDALSFQISPPVGQFRRIGELTLAGPYDGTVEFSARNSGGGIRPLPPVMFY